MCLCFVCVFDTELSLTRVCVLFVFLIPSCLSHVYVFCLSCLSHVYAWVCSVCVFDTHTNIADKTTLPAPVLVIPCCPCK